MVRLNVSHLGLFDAESLSQNGDRGEWVTMDSMPKVKVERSALISFSSRFTDSKRYEMYFAKCFSLEEERTGEICNACVLLVKRFIKLPLGSSRHWSHVVDARWGRPSECVVVDSLKRLKMIHFRSGPGIKSVAKAKKQSKVEDGGGVGAGVEGGESPDKFKRKHVYHRKLKPPNDKVVRKRNPSIDISPFLDMSFWKRYPK